MSNFRRLEISEFDKDFETTIKKCVTSIQVDEVISDDNREYYTSNQYLFDCLSNSVDFCVAERRNLKKFNQILNRRLIRFLMLAYPKCSILPSGNFIYPPGGYMSWHTNSDFPCKRLYVTYVKELNKSGFKYLDAQGAVVDDVDNAEITIREFDISSTEHLWHCVYSNTDRYSFGFRIEPF